MSGRILLENIFLELLVEEVIEEKEELIGISLFDNTVNIWDQIEKIPKVQSSSELQCWNCTLYPQGDVEGIPMFTYTDMQYTEQNNYMLHHNLFDSHIRTEVKREKYHGHFCSIFCAMAFLDETSFIPENDKERCRKTMYHLYSIKHKRNITYIPSAYPRYMMKMFSGEQGWSPQEYRDRNAALAKIIV